MFGFILIAVIGVFFLSLFVSTEIRRYRYKKTGTLLMGEVVDYERGVSSSRSIVFFVYKEKPLQMPLMQTYVFLYPKKGTMVDIYYTERYSDYVMLADRPQIVSQLILVIFALAFLVVGFMGIFGFIPIK